MPTISTFYGILIRMYFNDHAPPHFHARYGEFEATINLDTVEMMHREELLEDWRLCRENAVPAKIEPLA